MRYVNSPQLVNDKLTTDNKEGVSKLTSTKKIESFDGLL